MSIRVTTNIFCPEKHSACPYFGSNSIYSLLAERNYLRQRCNELEVLYNLAQQQILERDKQIAEFRQENEYLKEELRRALQRRFKKNIQRPEDQNLPDTRENKSRKRGAQVGHKGTTYKMPEHIDKEFHVIPEFCPHCNSTNLSLCKKVVKHTIQEIVIEPLTIRIYRHYAYCKNCKKVFSIRHKNDLERTYIGPKAKALGAHIRYKAGVSYGQLKDIFNIFGIKLSRSAFLGIDNKIAEYGQPFYDLLHQELLNSNSVNSDETNWRIDGINHWLWGLSNNWRLNTKKISFFHIDRHRSGDVAEKLLGEFKGILTADFYQAYNRINAFRKQRCLSHLLDDTEQLQQSAKDNPEVVLFCENLKNLLKQAMELRNLLLSKKIEQSDYIRKKTELIEQLDLLAKVHFQHKLAEALRKRLARYQNEILTFLDYPEIEPTNNQAERQLRRSVIFRKITFGNRSQKGANNHKVIMSLVQTAELNGSRPIDLLFSLLTRDTEDKISKILLGCDQPRPP